MSLSNTPLAQAAPPQGVEPGTPKITIVTPSYNQGPFLEKTIRSVLEQDYPNFEYIIIDGGSTDHSVDIIKRYADHLTYWESIKDRGQSDAINKGFARATGELLGWLNSDDQLEPGALRTVAAAAAAFPQAGVFVGHGRKLDESGKQVYYKVPRDLSFEGLCQWMSGNNFMQPSCFFRRGLWQQCGPLDEDVHIAMDVDLWLKMAKHTTFERIDTLLSSATYHPQAKTAALRHRMVVDCALVIMRNGGERYGRQYLDQMADRLAHAERQLRRVTRNPLYRLLRPLLKRRAAAPTGGQGRQS
jgi:glycosyltransferase involved in cell wall biosynthesis